MSDHTDSRLRELTYRLVAMAPETPPFPQESMVRLGPAPTRIPPTSRRRPLAWAVAAAVAVIVLIGTPLVLINPGGDSDPAPPASDTSAVTPTTVPDAALPGVFDLDAGTVVVAAPDASTSTRDGVVVYDAERAMGDGAGGLVIERKNTVLRVDADGSESVLLDAADLQTDYDRATLRLEDVAAVDGAPRAVVVVDFGTEYPDIFQEIWFVDLDGGAVDSVYRMVAVESNIVRASVAGGKMVLSISFEGGSYFEYLDTTGEPIEVAAPYDGGLPGGVADFPISITQAVLSPDGAKLAYLEIDATQLPDGDAIEDLVIWDLVGGVELQRLEIELGDGMSIGPGRLDYDGTGAVVGRFEGGDPSAPLAALWIPAIDAGTAAELDTAGNASLIK